MTNRAAPPPAAEPDDPWLRQALRHAPDVDTPVPGAVRSAILAQAQAAVAGATPSAAPARRSPAPASGWRRWLSAWWRPAPLGLAGALVAGLAALVVVRMPTPDAEAVRTASVSDGAVATLREAPASAAPGSDGSSTVVATAAPGSTKALQVAAPRAEAAAEGPETVSVAGRQPRAATAEAAANAMAHASTAPAAATVPTMRRAEPAADTVVAAAPVATPTPAPMPASVPAPAAASPGASPPADTIRVATAAAAPSPAPPTLVATAAAPAAPAAKRAPTSSADPAISTQAAPGSLSARPSAAGAAGMAAARVAPTPHVPLPAFIDPIAPWLLSARGAAALPMRWQADGREGVVTGRQVDWLQALGDAALGRWRTETELPAEGVGTGELRELRLDDRTLRVFRVPGTPRVWIETGRARLSATVRPELAERLDALARDW